jgi:hypothetical protein
MAHHHAHDPQQTVGVESPATHGLGEVDVHPLTLLVLALREEGEGRREVCEHMSLHQPVRTREVPDLLSTFQRGVDVAVPHRP